MGRRVTKASVITAQTDWIFKIGVDLNINNRAQIAFLSGLERSYYPEDPGFSKFGIYYKTKSGFGDETPASAFLHQTEKFKPISNKGFSIGGLFAPRFPPLSKINHNPSPDRYQPEVVKSLLDDRRKPVAKEDDFVHYDPEDPFMIRKQQRLLAQQHLQCSVSFGSFKGNPRFGRLPTFNTTGVGTYNATRNPPPSLKINSSFGRSPVLSQVNTEVRCIYENNEKCIECGVIITVCDFYRTRFTVPVPQPETRLLSEQDQREFPKGKKYVNLCNICFHQATLGHSQNWPKNKLRWIFKKTRTCAFIHEHQGLPQVVQKTECKMMKKLQRKEAILSKYYEDCVEESIPTAMY